MLAAGEEPFQLKLTVGSISVVAAPLNEMLL
jgi:hypothetical protein